MKFSSICILGGTGFVGRVLIDRLNSESGLPQLRCLTRAASQPTTTEKVEWICGDMLQKDSLKGFILPGSLVINLAYLSDSSKEVNLTAIAHLLEACRDAKASRLIHVSTAVVTGNVGPSLVTESTPCRPGTPYEQAKFEIEEKIRHEWDGDSAIIRPTAVFGECGKNLIKLADELSSDKRWKRYLKASILKRRSLNLVYVGNVVEAIVHVAKLPDRLNHECFIVSQDDLVANQYEAVSRALSKLLKIEPLKSPLIPVPNPLLTITLKMAGRPNPNPARRYSPGKLKATGFLFPYSLEEGLSRFANWYLASRKSERS